jgi:hypothetical protein
MPILEQKFRNITSGISSALLVGGLPLPAGEQAMEYECKVLRYTEQG